MSNQSQNLPVDTTTVTTMSNSLVSASSRSNSSIAATSNLGLLQRFKSLRIAPSSIDEDSKLPELTEEERLGLLQGRINPDYFLREDFCGACGIKHLNPLLLNLYSNCQHCQNTIRFHSVLRNVYKGIEQLTILDIVFATYGHPIDSKHAVDVTSQVKQLASQYAKQDRFALKAIQDLSTIFGDPSPGQPKQLRLRYRINNKFGIITWNVLPNNHLPRNFVFIAPHERLLNIIRASYGHPKGRISTGRMSYDVTEQIQGLVDQHGGSYLHISTSDSMASLLEDPCTGGYTKDLIIEYDINGQNGTVIYNTNDGYIQSKKDIRIKKLAIVAPLIFVETAFYGLTPIARRDKLQEFAKLLARIDNIEYRLSEGLPITKDDVILRRRKSSILEEQKEFRSLATRFIDVRDKIQSYCDQYVYFLRLLPEHFDPNIAFSNPSPGMRKVLEVNLRVVGHDSERRTSSNEITVSGFPRNYISGSAQRFLISVADDETGRGLMESPLEFSAHLAFSPIIIQNAVYGNLKVLSQVVDSTREVQSLVGLSGLRIPVDLNLDDLCTNPCPGNDLKQLRIKYTCRGMNGCLRIREKNDHLTSNIQLGYRPQKGCDDGEEEEEDELVDKNDFIIT